MLAGVMPCLLVQVVSVLRFGPAGLPGCCHRQRHLLKTHRSPLCRCCIYRWESCLQFLISCTTKAFICCIAWHEVCPHLLFMTLQIRWQGQDQEGHPLFIVHIGRLCNECQSHELAQQAADAIISQVIPCSQEVTLHSFCRCREEGAIV